MISSLGASLRKQCDTIIFHKLSNLFFRNSVLLQIAHISQKHDFALWLFVFVDLLHPKLTQLSERKSIINFVHKDYCISTSVICWDNGSKVLRPCSVPNLHFDCGAVDFHGFELEIYAYGWYCVCWKDVVNKTQQQTTFTYAWTTCNYHFESFIVLF